MFATNAGIGMEQIERGAAISDIEEDEYESVTAREESVIWIYPLWKKLLLLLTLLSYQHLLHSVKSKIAESISVLSSNLLR